MEIVRPEAPAPICWMPACLNNIIEKKVNNAALSCLETFVDFICTYLWYGYHQFYEQRRLQALGGMQPTADNALEEQRPVLLPGQIFNENNVSVFDRTTEKTARIAQIGYKDVIHIDGRPVVSNPSFGRVLPDGTRPVEYVSIPRDSLNEVRYEIHDAQIKIFPTNQADSEPIKWDLDPIWMRDYTDDRTGGPLGLAAEDAALLVDRRPRSNAQNASTATGPARQALLVRSGNQIL